MNNKNKYQEDVFIARWISGELSDKESQEFEQWIMSNPDEKLYFEELQNVWHGFESIKLKEGRSKEERWQGISERLYLQPQSVTNNRTQNIAWKIASLAAAVVVILGGYFLWTNQQTISIIAPRGTRTTANLPDGSEVILNAESTLKYSEKNWQKSRQVQLSGEAFFDVVQAKVPFIVKSDFVITEVLGTRFNVNTHGNHVEVACATGRIQVKNEKIKHEPVVLTAGLASVVTVQRAPSQPYVFDVVQKQGWTSGEFYFQSTPLEEVFAEIGRQFDFTIEMATSIVDLTFTGRVQMSELSTVLDFVCLSSGLKFRKVGETTYLIYE